MRNERNRVPSVDLRKYRPGSDATKRLTRTFCESRVVMPVRALENSFIIAMVRPNEAIMEEVALLTGLQVEVVRAAEDDIRESIKACYGAAN